MSSNERLRRFTELIKLRTVSNQPGSGFDPEPFRKMLLLLEESYPVVHEVMDREIASDYSLLYSLSGFEPDLPPVMLTAHLDVVPADDGDDWLYPPFSGKVAEGRLWGRGAVDYKLGLFGMMEACSRIFLNGDRPARSLMLAFGHDEETGGDLGARCITDLLESRGVRLSSVLDEGGYIYSYPWLKREVAVIGLAEKGYLTLRLTARDSQRHASIPGGRTALGRLCGCLSALEENQMPAKLCSPVRIFLEETAPLFRDHVSPADMKGMEQVMSGYPQGDCLLRTTTAITMVSGSSKENVIPGSPFALVNFRAVPGDHSDDIIRHVAGIAEEAGVEVDYEDTNHIHQPSAISSMDTGDYRALAGSIEETWPGLAVVPGIFPAATDSRHYCRIAENIYRFQPVHLGPRGLSMLHSVDESVDLKDLDAVVDFYSSYIRRMCFR